MSWRLLVIGAPGELGVVVILGGTPESKSSPQEMAARLHPACFMNR
jgi:hypothetical protein